MGVKLVSASGGSVEINPPATASNFVATMPAGTGNVVVNGVNGALVSGTAVASTSGTSIDFTGIPSWVKRVTIIFNGVSLSSTSSLLIQLGTSGGVDTSSYVSTSVIARDGTTSTGLTSTSGCVMTVAAAASLVYGTMQIVNVSGNIWVFSSSYGISGATQTGVSGGNKTLSGTLDRVRITTVSGTDTFDAGSINILYE